MITQKEIKKDLSILEEIIGKLYCIESFHFMFPNGDEFKERYETDEIIKNIVWVKYNLELLLNYVDENKDDSVLIKNKKDEPIWIVNDLGELGVKVNDRFFFLYKGRSIEYEDCYHEDDNTPMMYRPVGKREFGEVCHPFYYYERGWSQHKRYTEELVHTPGLSNGKPEDYKWKPLTYKK